MIASRSTVGKVLFTTAHLRHPTDGSFDLGDGFHLATAGATVLLAALVAYLGRRLRDHRGERAVRLGLAASIAGLQAATLGFVLATRGFDPADTLPLHLCDLAFLPAAWALWRWQPADGERARTAAALAYFWGLGLSTQAIVTPIVRVGASDPAFWFFWGNHALLLAAAVYLVAARAFRPRLTDVRTALVLTLAWGLPVLALDLACGWNYGFLGPADVPGTILDWFPPWPWRLLVMYLAAAIVFLLLWLVGPRSTPTVPSPPSERTR